MHPLKVHARAALLSRGSQGSVHALGRPRSADRQASAGVLTHAQEDVPMKPLGSDPASQLPAASVSTAPDDDGPIAALPAPGTTQDPRADDISKVLVAGGTGGVGREVVRQLSAKGIQVVALVRDINKAASKLPTANVQLVQGDLYQYDTIPGALQGCDAVICAASTREFLDPLGPFKVDFSGTVNLIDCARKEGVDKFVLVSSIGADDGLLSPLGPVLFWKKRAEEHLQRSPLQHTIVRPGGLVSDAAEAAAGAAGASKSPVAALLEAVFGSSRTRGEGNLVFGSAGAFGLPPKRSGSVKRSKVAECCIEALTEENAADTVVEVIADPAAPELSWEQLFAVAAKRVV